MGIRKQFNSLLLLVLKSRENRKIQEIVPAKDSFYGISLSYGAQAGGDGSGAQLQAIAAVYGLSRKFGFGFLNQPIQQIALSPGDGMESNKQRSAESKKLSQLFCLDSSPALPTQPARLFRAKTLTPGILLILMLASRLFQLCRTNAVCLISNPHQVSDAMPEIYDYASEIWSRTFQRETPPSTEGLSMAVHFRRETLPQYLPSGDKNPRFLVSSWYEFVVSSCKDVFSETGHRFSYRIHTDFREDLNREVTGSFHPEGVSYMRSAGALKPDGKSYRDPEDVEFVMTAREEGIPVLTNIPPSMVFQDLADADIFVGSKSSMSFVAGLIRWGKPTVMPEFWHNCPSQ